MSVDGPKPVKSPPAWLARIVSWTHRWLGSMRRAIVPPQLYLFELSTALWTAQCLSAIARLNVADRLAEMPLSAQQLADDLGLHAPSLYRVLRLLCGYGVFHEDRSGLFSLTPIGQRLRSDVPDSARAMLVYNGQPWQTEPYSHIEYTLRTGRPSFDQIFGAPFFEYAAGQPEVARIFDEAMTSVASLHVSAVSRAYDFGEVGLLADIGGGNGLFLSHLLAKHPRLRGVLLDLPHAAATAAAALARAGVSDRCTVEAGSFFDRVPENADAYLLSHVMHDWDDARCRAILRNCRRAMRPNSRLLVVDVVLGRADNRFAQGKLADIQMLLVLSGRERTEPEFRGLLESEDFVIQRIVPTSAPESIIEAVPRGVRSSLRTNNA
ncbi:MAG TPA: methyltransferase [Candidatus Eremiobacteraceae bacterium]|nr:methyltransferase [Candidatus Eremiobacteraceae bacterium]